MTPADAPIGLFDSGVGGLSVLAAARAALPHEDFVYAADSAYAPYGDRDTATVVARADAVVQALVARGAKAIVVACNTATALAVEHLRTSYRVPIVAMEPAIKPACATTRSGQVAVLATRQTVTAGNTTRLCERYAGSATVHLVACPGVVECIEAGELDGPRLCALLNGYLAPLRVAGVDVIVLGCTHYPLAHATIARLAGDAITLIDPAPAVARELARRLDHAGLRSTCRRRGHETFLSSRPDAATAALLARLWGHPLTLGALDATV
ncbi:MAG: glutamate racemase [Gammaproteobacteria bacterium]